MNTLRIPFQNLTNVPIQQQSCAPKLQFKVRLMAKDKRLPQTIKREEQDEESSSSAYYEESSSSQEESSSSQEDQEETSNSSDDADIDLASHVGESIEEENCVPELFKKEEESICDEDERQQQQQQQQLPRSQRSSLVTSKKPTKRQQVSPKNTLKRKRCERSSSKSSEKRQGRFKKDKWQIRILAERYRQGTDWSKETIRQLSQRTQLKTTQVYKWLWDQRTKNSRRRRQQGHCLLGKGPAFSRENLYEGRFLDSTFLSNRERVSICSQIEVPEGVSSYMQQALQRMGVTLWLLDGVQRNELNIEEE